MIDDSMRIALRPERVSRLLGYAYPVGAIAGSSSLVALTVFVLLEYRASWDELIGPGIFAWLAGTFVGLIAAWVVVLLETVLGALFGMHAWHMLRGLGGWLVHGLAVGAASGATLLFLFVALGRNTSGVGGHETSLMGATVVGLVVGGLTGLITGALMGWIKRLAKAVAPSLEEQAVSRHTMDG